MKQFKIVILILLFFSFLKKNNKKKSALTANINSDLVFQDVPENAPKAKVPDLKPQIVAEKNELFERKNDKQKTKTTLHVKNPIVGNVQHYIKPNLGVKNPKKNPIIGNVQHFVKPDLAIKKY